MAIIIDKNYLKGLKNFETKISTIYNCDLDESLDRIENLFHIHNRTNARLFSSPGRIEICGNHTDHNNGMVLCAAISIDTLAVVNPTEDYWVEVNSIGYPPVRVDLRNLEVVEAEKGTSFALVRGVARSLKDRGYTIGGFVATTSSNVFKGAGVSSSAAFEVLVAEIFNVLYNKSIISNIEKAIVSQFAENIYFGKPSGLMDQSAIALGGVSFIDFKDTQNPIVDNLKWGFDDISVVIVNCGGDHCNLTPHYAAIREEMEEVAHLFGQEKLRFVDEETFYNSIIDIKDKVSGRAILRAIHFFEENKRVMEVRDAIKSGEEDVALKKITESGDSSYKKLQNCYPEGDPSQTIPLALSVASMSKGVRAFRVHGGGFAGTMLSFVTNEEVMNYKIKMCKMFGKENVFVLKIRNSGAEEIILN